MVSSSCPLPKNVADLRLKGDPVLGPLTFQHLMLLISAAACGVTLAFSLWLVFKHLHRYTEPRQQRQIIRIICTPVVFSVASVISLLSYSASYYITPVRDLYETFALASIFLLFTEFVSPDPSTRDTFFDRLDNQTRKGGRSSFFSRSKEIEVIPGGSLRWFQSKWVAVFLYVFVQIIMTAAQEVSQALHTYCQNSLSPKYAHIWILVVSNVAITVAIQAVLTYYVRLTRLDQFKTHRPLLKLISFKLIVGVNFVQDTTFSLLTGNDVIHGTHRITGKDLAIGIPALMVALEQVLFSIFFHYAFRSREYHETEKAIQNGQGGVVRMGTFRAAAHAFNPSDLFHGVFYAFQLLFSGVSPVGNGNSTKSPLGLFARGRSQYSTTDAHSMESMYRPSATHHTAYKPQPRHSPIRYQNAPSPSPPRYPASEETQYLTADPTRYERSRSREYSRSSSRS